MYYICIHGERKNGISFPIHTYYVSIIYIYMRRPQSSWVAAWFARHFSINSLGLPSSWQRGTCCWKDCSMVKCTSVWRLLITFWKSDSKAFCCWVPVESATHPQVLVLRWRSRNFCVSTSAKAWTESWFTNKNTLVHVKTFSYTYVYIYIYLYLYIYIKIMNVYSWLF